MLLTTTLIPASLLLHSFTVPPVPGVAVPRGVNPRLDLVVLLISIPLGRDLSSPIGRYVVPSYFSTEYFEAEKLRRKRAVSDTACILILLRSE